MSRKQALSMYLLGTFGQVLGVSLLVWFLRAGGVKVDFTSPIGIITMIVGGLSSALWGSLASISYHQSSFKQVLKVFFQVKDSLANYCLVLVFLLLDFFPFILGGKITTQSLVLPVVLFFKALLFGGIEEIGWRYFFQPTLDEKRSYLSATLITFLAWSIWHLFYFYIDGSFPCLVPLAYPYLSTPLDYSGFIQLSHLLPDDPREYLPIWSAQGVLERSYSLYPRSYADR